MTKIQTPRPPGSMATAREIAAWIEETYHWQAEVSRMLNGGVESTSQLAADSVSVETADGTKLSGIVPYGDKAQFTGDLLAGAQVWLPNGTSRWNVSLEPDVYFLADGDSVDFDATFGEPAAIAFDVDGLDIPDWASGESFLLEPANLDETGFTASLKIAALGTPTTVTESTNATSPPGPAQMVAKADADLALNGVYTFRITGTVTMAQYATPQGTVSTGFVSFRSWFHDGASWVQGPSIPFNAYDPTGLSSGSVAFDQLFGVSYTGTIRSDAVLGCFGVDYESGAGSLTDLVSVSYQKRGAGSPRTASPNGETCRVSVYPRNTQ